MEDSGSIFAAIFGIVFFLVYMGLIVLLVAGQWKMFVKAGKPGWAAIVPIYNFIILLEIVGKPLWWVVLLFVPVANFVIIILIMLELAKVFGKSAGFGVGLILLSPIFITILGFGSAQYVGPATQPPQAM